MLNPYNLDAAACSDIMRRLLVMAMDARAAHKGLDVPALLKLCVELQVASEAMYREERKRFEQRHFQF